MNIDPTQFEDIRPFTDAEVPQAIESLIANQACEQAFRYVKPDIDWGTFAHLMRSFKTIKDFKERMAYNIVADIARSSAFSLTISGRSRLPEGHVPCTFISNHRDIVLDAAFLNVTLYDVGYGMTQIAIGDNLLISSWIETLVKLNNSFIVKRSVSGRQQLQASLNLSSYIHYTITQVRESVWIAQREGRAKDSDDKTQSSILKMLNMGGDADIVTNLMALNIVPVAISYEQDPCDFLKAKEFQQKRDCPDFIKSKRDDLLNMETGILGNKKRVHFTICSPINPQLQLLDRTLDRNELYNRIAQIIDTEIYKHYRFYPCNYIAHDLLNNSGRFALNYGPNDKQQFATYVQTQLDKIVIPNKDEDYLRARLLEMYANPLRNHLLAQNIQ
ncbi:MAG: acyltransferase [Tannerellaceae bacterium]|jgi:hypothetical protein|nr:acyltransferase [Tannerellaceae bacterium]